MATRTKVEQNIYSRQLASGKTVFDVNFRDGAGKLKWECGLAGIKAARSFRDAQKVKRDRGELPIFDGTTVGGLLDAYYEHLAKLESGEKVRAATTTSIKRNLDRHVRHALEDTFGEIKLSKLTRRHIHLLVSELRANLADSTARLVLTQFGSALQFAKRNELIVTNLVRDLDKDEKPSAKTKKKVQPLEPDELRRVLEKAPEHWRLPFMTAAWTGLRQSELLGLTWDEIDFEQNVIHVRHQLARGMKLLPLKTDASERDVLLSPSLATKLKEAFLAAGRPSEGFVFTTELGQARNHRVSLDVFQTACKNAGIHGRSFHDLRHTFASSLIAAGVDIVFTSRQLGHHSPSVTLNTYAHIFDKARRVEQATAALEAQAVAVLG